MEWTDKHTEMVIELKQTHTWKELAEIMSKEMQTEVSIDRCRHYYRKYHDGPDRRVWNNQYRPKEERVNQLIEAKQNKVTIEQRANGEQISERTIEATEEQLKDIEFVLKSHGYDPAHWQVVKHRSSLWEQFSNKNGLRTLYASRLEVEPITDKLTYEEMINLIASNVKPIEINKVNYKIKDKRMLEISLMDMHFGINTLEDYKDTFDRITTHLCKRVWEQVVITFGSDLMHVDNLKNTTANQTRIEDVDVPKMINDVKTFYEQLVNLAIKQSNEVKIYYVKGNHDETTSGLLIHWLKARFPQIEIDKTIEELKVHTWKNVFVAFTHGDKGGKRVKSNLAARYPKEWANASIRELHKGHEHHEKVLNDGGITERTLPTGAKTDQYHKDNSYDGTVKRFQLFEYSGDWLESIHYV